MFLFWLKIYKGQDFQRHPTPFSGIESKLFMLLLRFWNSESESVDFLEQLLKLLVHVYSILYKYLNQGRNTCIWDSLYAHLGQTSKVKEVDTM